VQCVHVGEMREREKEKLIEKDEKVRSLGGKAK
jgi:hypothetical protein